MPLRKNTVEMVNKTCWNYRPPGSRCSQTRICLGLKTQTKAHDVLLTNSTAYLRTTNSDAVLTHVGTVFCAQENI